MFEGWRDSTVDVDLRLEPVSDDLLRAISELKHLNEINVEFAGPADFIPMPPGWEERSPSVGRFGVLDVRHIDFYAQALAKLERGHARDVEDVRAMFDRGLVERQRLVELFDAIEPELHRFPAIEPSAFRAAVEAA